MKSPPPPPLSSQLLAPPSSQELASRTPKLGSKDAGGGVVDVGVLFDVGGVFDGEVFVPWVRDSPYDP